MISLELNLIPNQPILIGVSGGIDSVCLLDLLQKKIEKKWIIVLHLNHQLRKEANSDEKFVCKLAEQYQIKVETKKVDVQHLTQNSSKGLELIAREQRHLFFSQMQEKYQAQALLLAHHADDQTETILYNLFRGSKGIKGIKKESILKVFDSA